MDFIHKKKFFVIRSFPEVVQIRCRRKCVSRKNLQTPQTVLDAIEKFSDQSRFTSYLMTFDEFDNCYGAKYKDDIVNQDLKNGKDTKLIDIRWSENRTGFKKVNFRKIKVLRHLETLFNLMNIPPINP